MNYHNAFSNDSLESSIGNCKYNKTRFLQFSASWPLSRKKGNDKIDNLGKIHCGIYIASALFIVFVIEVELLQKECLFLLYKKQLDVILQLSQ